MSRSTRCIAAVLAVAVVATVLGCGEDGPDLAPVAGQITLDGDPLPDATVTFLPADGGTLQTAAVGTTDSQGRFVMFTTGRMGAVPGRYAVTIVSTLGRGQDEELPDDRSLWKVPENPIPLKYGDPADPELTFTVPPNGTEEAEFALDSTK